MSDPRFAELLERYWNVAIAQGWNRMTHDDEQGSAQDAEAALHEFLRAALVEERKRALEFLSAKCEEEGEKLMERWHSDLGATDGTRAAGIASYIINDFHTSLEVKLMKMEKPE